ncbi:hypothetical protein K503DRAFT_122536 [Rhizopogon vinicolor AM-OR11-026]|uniref:Uncharacterized protein n=1 Tax=Rhizopogon vinicolor AM-OR11-026 TaxID=1314800 RepID=A0A1B7MEP9_9AGAM|nr:hypothetical protein K503DRAFT_122536 [Rhizopogon vinicolor AM-OR11-026]
MISDRPSFDDHLYCIVRNMLGERSMAARRTLWSESSRHRYIALSLDCDKLGWQFSHRLYIPLPDSKNYTSRRIWFLRRAVSIGNLGWQFCLFCLPETAGLSLEEVQSVF